MKGVKE